MQAEGAALLRLVLRAHRACMPAPVRALGDSFVLSEFRAVGRLATAGELRVEHAQSFKQEWLKYAAHVRSRAAGGAADAEAIRYFDQDAASLAQGMNDDQRVMLAKLRQEAGKAHVAGEGSGAGGSAGAS